jgi:hypothetical protein
MSQKCQMQTFDKAYSLGRAVAPPGSLICPFHQNGLT